MTDEMKEFLTYKDALVFSGYMEVSVNGPIYMAPFAGQKFFFIKKVLILEFVVAVSGWLAMSQQELACEAVVQLTSPNQGLPGLDSSFPQFTEQSPTLVLHDGQTHQIPIMRNVNAGEAVTVGGICRFATTAGIRYCGVWYSFFYSLTD